MRRVRELLRWPAPLLAPVQARLRRQGVLATAPVTLSIIALSFAAAFNTSTAVLILLVGSIFMAFATVEGVDFEFGRASG